MVLQGAKWDRVADGVALPVWLRGFISAKDGSNGGTGMTERASFRTIDSIRAVAAIAVVWGHCFNMLLRPVRPGDGPVYHALALSASFGRDAVMTFFVISGYWITRSVLANVRRGTWSWRDYLVNRLSRLWIVLLPALALGAILDGAGRYLFDVAPYRALGYADFFDVGSRLSARILLGNIVFLQNLAVPPFGSNGPLWTLACEFWYYVWFPTLLLAVRGRPKVAALAATAATIYLFGMNALLFACWLCGSVVAWWDHETERATVRPAIVRWMSAMLGTLAWLICTASARVHGVEYHLGSFLISAGFAVLLAVILRHEIGSPAIMAPLSAYGASSSFSLYAVHMPVFAVILASVCGSHPLAPSPANVTIAAIVLSLLIGVGWVFSRLTEAKTGQFRHRLQSVAVSGSAWSGRLRLLR